MKLNTSENSFKLTPLPIIPEVIWEVAQLRKSSVRETVSGTASEERERKERNEITRIRSFYELLCPLKVIEYEFHLISPPIAETLRNWTWFHYAVKAPQKIYQNESQFVVCCKTNEQTRSEERKRSSPSWYLFDKRATCTWLWSSDEGFMIIVSKWQMSAQSGDM